MGILRRCSNRGALGGFLKDVGDLASQAKGMADDFKALGEL